VDESNYVPTATTQSLSDTLSAIAFSAAQTDYVSDTTQSVTPSLASTAYVPPATTVSYTTIPSHTTITVSGSAVDSWTQVVSAVTPQQPHLTTVPTAAVITVPISAGSTLQTSWTQVVEVFTLSPTNTPSLSYTTVPSGTLIWESSGTGSVQVSLYTQVVSVVTPSASPLLSYTTVPSYTVVNMPLSGAGSTVVTSWTQQVVTVTPGVYTSVSGGSTELLVTDGATITSVIGGKTIISTGTSAPSSKAGVASLSDNSSGKSATVVLQWTAAQVFMGTYLTVLMAVLYRMVWTVIKNNFNLIEPFRQLTEKHGALAERALFSFYQSQSNLMGPIPAILKGRWALALVSTTYLLACFLPALSSEAIYVDTDWGCPFPIAGKNPCQARMTVNVVVVRVLQGVLAFAALAILATVSLLLFTKTGLPADPSSMATIASLMRHPALLDDLNEIPADASGKLMKRAMAGRRYRLDAYKTNTGGSAYGIVPAYGPDAFEQEHAHGYTNVAGASSRSRSHRFRITDFVLLVVVLGVLGVVFAYYFDGKPDGFNNYFSSNTFGPRFIFTGSATILASLWKTVEQSAVITAPYTRLARHPSPAKSTIPFTPHNTPVFATLGALRHGYYLVALLTFTTLTGEALNIVISGIPYATGQTWSQFLVSTYLSLAVLGLMLLVCAVLIFSRTREPKVPRHPDTVGAVMSYLCASQVLRDFEGTDGQDEGERDRRIRLLGKRYTFEERRRGDGRHAWTVDELRGAYE
ncbi:hypothetical protein LTR53_017191, partial [Teratosphaeriaceae sp. CCFEE 6253]